MGSEYSPATDMWVPEQWTFIDALSGMSGSLLTIVIHKTAGGASEEAVAQYFLSGSNGQHKSVHFIVGQDGDVIQCVHLKDGAGGNCCPDGTHTSYWEPLINQFTNLNLCTISIEHVDPSPDNSTALTPAQQLASFQLVLWLCRKFNIHPEHIQPHNSINVTHCPGNYPLSELVQFVRNSMQGTSNQSKQFDEIWAIGAGTYVSGIAKIVKEGALAGFYSPCFCTSPEHDIIDWEGNPGILQYLSNGLYVFFRNGEGTVYNTSNQVLYRGRL